MSTKLQIRLEKTKEILMQTYPEGITAPEIADRLGVTRQTSSADIKRLEDLNIPIEQGEGGIHHYCIDPRKNIQPLTLTAAGMGTLPSFTADGTRSDEPLFAGRWITP